MKNAQLLSAVSSQLMEKPFGAARSRKERRPVAGQVRRLVTVSVAALGLLASGMAAAQNSIKWRYFTYLGVNDKPTHFNRAFADDVFKATNGRLKIEVFAAGQLPYKVPDVLRAVATNQIQMGEVVVGGSGDVSEINVLQLPLLCTSYQQFEAALPVVRPIIDTTLKNKFGVDVLMHWTMPAQNLWLNKPVASLADLRSMKVRTWNAEQVEMLRLLGASAMSITSAEVIPALERQVIDGAITSSISANDWRAYDIVKSGYMLNMTMGHQLMTVNGAALAQLPSDVRSILIAKATEWTPKFLGMSEEGDIAARRNMATNGVNLVEPSAADLRNARDLMRPMWDRWADKHGTQGRRLLDAARNACSAS